MLLMTIESMDMNKSDDVVKSVDPQRGLDANDEFHESNDAKNFEFQDLFLDLIWCGWVQVWAQYSRLAEQEKTVVRSEKRCCWIHNV